MNKECIHIIRDNNFGVTWCVSCGRLFTKPANKKLKNENKKIKKI